MRAIVQSRETRFGLSWCSAQQLQEWVWLRPKNIQFTQLYTAAVIFHLAAHRPQMANTDGKLSLMHRPRIQPAQTLPDPNFPILNVPSATCKISCSFRRQLVRQGTRAASLSQQLQVRSA